MNTKIPDEECQYKTAKKNNTIVPNERLVKT